MATRETKRLDWNATSDYAKIDFSGSAVVEDKVKMPDDGSLGMIINYSSTENVTKQDYFGIKAGVGNNAGQGNLEFLLGTTATEAVADNMRYAGPFESARFKDEDGYLNWAISKAGTATDNKNEQTTTIPEGSGYIVLFEMPSKVEFTT